MFEYFKAESVNGERFNVVASLTGIPNASEVDITRGDGILIDKLENGKKIGGKEFVIVAGFTYYSKSSPPITMWYGDPEYITKTGRFVVLGRFFTEEFKKEIIKIEIPKNTASIL